MSLRCLSEPFVEQNRSMDQIHHRCSVGNPFSGPGNLWLRVQLLPGNDIIGNENDVAINFNVDSINPENTNTIMDDSNFDSAQLTFEARANNIITVDNG